MSWYVYIVTCKDKTLYTGITNNLNERIDAHNAGEGAKYTRGRRPVRLLHKEMFRSRGKALKREYEIKQLTKSRKEELISKKHQ